MQKPTRLPALSVLALSLMLGLSEGAWAQGAQGDGARREAAELRIEELKQRLALTPEQESKLAPVIEARNAKLRELRSSNGGDSSRRARFATLKEAREIQESFNAQIEPILTKEQYKEWEKIREEVRATAKERRRERQ